MEVELRYVDGCPNWREVHGVLVELLAARDDAELRLRRVGTAEQARRLGFHGSPTVLIDGGDPFPVAGDGPGGLACRVYATPDGLRGAPTRAQLRAVLG